MRDRCTRSHESIFLLAKQRRYYFDAKAIRERSSPNTHARRAPVVPSGWANGNGSHDAMDHNATSKHRKTRDTVISDGPTVMIMKTGR